MKISFTAIIVLIALVGAPALRSQITYSVLDLGTLGGTASAGNALSRDGQVVGTSYLFEDTVQNAFVTGFDGARPMRNLGTLGGSASFGQAITSSGMVAGTSHLSGDTQFRAFLSGPNGGALTPLNTLGGANGYAFGVNGAGQVAGYALLAGNKFTHAYLSAANGGAAADLGVLPGGNNSFAYAVNASGQVAGYSDSLSGSNHAFISDKNGGPLRDLGTLGGRYSFGLAINDAGQIVGRSEMSGVGQHAFRSAPNGGPLLDLGTLGGYSSFGEGINAAGTVVGYSYLSDNSTQHAFLYLTAFGMLDLNNLLVPGSGWVLTEARAINDRGQITGYGSIDGATHAFLLTPIATGLRITSIVRLPNGHVVVRGVGAPLQSHGVEASTDVRAPFVRLATINANSTGALEFEDADAANAPGRFYRFTSP